MSKRKIGKGKEPLPAEEPGVLLGAYLVANGLKSPEPLEDPEHQFDLEDFDPSKTKVQYGSTI